MRPLSAAGGGGFAGLVSARHGLCEHRLGRVEIARGAERDPGHVDRIGEQARVAELAGDRNSLLQGGSADFSLALIEGDGSE